jgi:dihydrofolate reductase
MSFTFAEKAPSPRLISIAAMASNRVIGRDGKLPWHLPEDLRFFKKTTQGHPVLMGRNTFDSIVAQLGKPLPGRRNIVLSKTMPAREGVDVIRRLDELGSLSGLTSPIYLIGGAQLYETLLPQCDELLLTCISAPHEGDTFFPPFEHLFMLKEVIARGDGFEMRRYVTSSARPSP